jgi:hypothetical protein
MKAILTGDLIGSTKLPLEIRDVALHEITSGFPKFEVWRGDYFQGEMPPEEGLRYALLLKSGLNKIAPDTGGKQSKVVVDTKLAIGLGNVYYEKNSVRESDGPAYHLSGRAFDKLKHDKRQFIIVTENDEYNKELDILSLFLELIFQSWTIASAEVVYFLLQGKNENEISKALGISQPAVNQRKKAAEWDSLERILTRYVEIVNKLKP